MKQIYLALIPIFIFSILQTSCGDDNGPDPGSESPDLEDLIVRSISVVDLSNNGNSSDVGIVYRSPDASITNFRIFIVKAETSGNFSQSIAEGLDESRYHEVVNSEESYSVQLPEDRLDSDGDNIAEGVLYQIVILSVSPLGSILSDLSDQFELIPFSTGVFTIKTTFNSTDGYDGIALDSDGNIYVSNFGVFVDGAGSGSQLFKIDRFAQRSHYASGLKVPGGCVAGPSGVVYVSNDGKIDKVLSNGAKTVHASSEAGFAGLAIDEQGNIYSGGYSHNLVLKVDPNGTVSTIAEDERLIGTVGMAYHAESATLYAGNFNNGSIYAITMSGEVTRLTQIGGIGYITEMNGFLYATEFSANRIARISLDGQVERIAGSGVQSQTDGSLLEATFNQPNGIIGDAENNALYVSDWGSPRITKIQL